MKILNDTFLNSCKIYSFDGMHWNQEYGCMLDPTTDVNTAVLKCSVFGTFGVACQTQPLNMQITNQTITIASTGDSVLLEQSGVGVERTAPLLNSGSQKIRISVFIIGIFGLLFL